jgi:hypothetical protein
VAVFSKTYMYVLLSSFDHGSCGDPLLPASAKPRCAGVDVSDRDSMSVTHLPCLLLSAAMLCHAVLCYAVRPRSSTTQQTKQLSWWLTGTTRKVGIVHQHMFVVETAGLS